MNTKAHTLQAVLSLLETTKWEQEKEEGEVNEHTQYLCILSVQVNSRYRFESVKSEQHGINAKQLFWTLLPWIIAAAVIAAAAAFWIRLHILPLGLAINCAHSPHSFALHFVYTPSELLLVGAVEFHRSFLMLRRTRIRLTCEWKQKLEIHDNYYYEIRFQYVVISIFIVYGEAVNKLIRLPVSESGVHFCFVMKFRF